jgi:hypothetical protein
MEVKLLVTSNYGNKNQLRLVFFSLFFYDGKFDVFCRTISWQLSLVKNISVRIGVRF